MAINDWFSMRHGPKDDAAGGKPQTTERGTSGGFVSGGVAIHGAEIDINSAWRPPLRWATVRKMRAFPSTNAAMDAIVLALLSERLDVVPAGDSPEDVELAEFIKNDLENLSHQSLFDTRFEALDGALWEGCAPYQTIFRQGDSDGRWHLHKLAYRPPATVSDWHEDIHGGPDGITQLDNEGTPHKFEMDELLVFVHRRRGGSLVGTPLARRMYASWYMLDKLYKIAPMAIERHAMGIPVMRGATTSTVEADRIEEVLMGVRSNSMGYVRLSEAQSMDDFKVLGLTGSTLDPVPLMEYLRRDIFLSTFTQGQVLGSDGVGSLALGETQTSVLMLMLKAIAQMEEDTYNRFLLPRWIGYNQALPENGLPRVVIQPPTAERVVPFFESVLQGTQAGISWDRDLIREKAHEEIGTPLPADRTNAESSGEPREAPSLGRPNSDSGDGTPKQENARKSWPGVGFAAAGDKELRSDIALEALGIAPDFAQMASRYEQAEQDIVKAVSAIQRRQISNLTNRAREIVEKDDPALVAQTEIRFQDEMAAAISAILEDVYLAGIADFQDEIRQQGETPVPVEAEERSADLLQVAAVALLTARLVGDRLLRAWGDVALEQVRRQTFDKKALAARLSILSDKTVADHAKQDTTVASGMGRHAGMKASLTLIDHFINTERLDGNTCKECADADGDEVAIKDVALYEPFHKCEGGKRCRGFLVAVLARG